MSTFWPKNLHGKKQLNTFQLVLAIAYQAWSKSSCLICQWGYTGLLLQEDSIFQLLKATLISFSGKLWADHFGLHYRHSRTKSSQHEWKWWLSLQLEGSLHWVFFLGRPAQPTLTLENWENEEKWVGSCFLVVVRNALWGHIWKHQAVVLPFLNILFFQVRHLKEQITSSIWLTGSTFSKYHISFPEWFLEASRDF